MAKVTFKELGFWLRVAVILFWLNMGFAFLVGVSTGFSGL